MPLDDFNTKKCKGKKLKQNGFKMDACMFGDPMRELTDELVEAQKAGVSQTSY